MLSHRLAIFATLTTLPVAAQVSLASNVTTERPRPRHAPISIIEEREDGTVSSNNWSGYAITGAAGSFTAAEGSWIVPAVTCTSGTQYAAFWVGIDGYSSTTVEQTGTDSDCSKGVPTYYAWYEFYPKASKDIAAFPVHPGDVISASVTFSAGIFTVSITDGTSGKTFTTTGTVSGAQRSSAEF